MTPPTSRTWSRRGLTPVIRVRGRSRRRLSVAALTCYKPGERPRLIYRPARDRRSDGRKSFDWRDYRDLLVAAHTQLGGPILVIWDNLNTHLAKGMREFIEAHEGLTVIQLPPYSPDLNSVEGVWSLLRRKLANTAFVDPDHLINAVRRGLREIQYRPELIDGVLAETGLTSTPSHHNDTALSSSVGVGEHRDGAQVSGCEASPGAVCVSGVMQRWTCRRSTAVHVGCIFQDS